ncbi:hypothetical protein ACOMHN_019644 [Nucella lapillus]
MGLVMKSKIHLDTQLGQSEIQLLFGDITQLPKEDKVDFIFVSAFPGDYTPVSGTMIGALKRNLGLNVRDVAADKASDLRQGFSCWVSKPLPSHVPYQRLVCFERFDRFENMAVKLAEQISGMFRAMMPVFNNQDTSVITPLLASGNQGHSEVSMLRTIVSAACHWIKAGLPLRCLKIVIYTNNPHLASQSTQELLEVFTTLKTKWEEKQGKEAPNVEKTIDVCLSFSGGDEEYVEKVCSDLHRMHTGIVIHKEQFVYDHTAVWQEKIFTVMVTSRKIIAILTPNYVEKPECLEEFNLALCCNRLTGAEVLAPFYLRTVDNFPAYMTLIQYTECRVRNEGEKEEEKIFSACCMLLKDIYQESDSDTASNPSITNQTDGSTRLSILPAPFTPSYDIFISYAHKTPKEAHKFYENVFDIDSNLRVFLDRSELRTGNSWQKALYEAVDRAKVVVVFISDCYIQSTVCQEEYNIALARYMSADGIYFLPLLTTSSIKELPAMYSAAPLIDVSGLVYEEDHFLIAETVVKWLEVLKGGSPVLNRFRLIDPVKKTRIPFVTVRWRQKLFDQRFCFKRLAPGIGLRSVNVRPAADPQTTTTPTPTPTPTPPIPTPTPKSVVFSSAQDCSKQAALLSRLLQENGEGGVSCELLTSVSRDEGPAQASKLQLLDSADMLVLMVSDDYLESVQHLHELHVSLCRQRMCKDQRVVVYLIEAYHSKREPVYAHLLHYTISLGDELWANLARKLYGEEMHVVVHTPDSRVKQVTCGSAEYLALYAAHLDILSKLDDRKGDGGSGMPCNIVNLVDLKETSQNPVVASKLLLPFSSLVDERPSHERSEVAAGEKPPVSRTKSSKQTEGASARIVQMRQSIHSSQSCQLL